METDAPDIYTDTITLAAGPFGFTLTLYLSDPETASQENPGKVVGRVRFSPELAGALGDVLAEAIADYRKAQARAKTGKA